MGIFALIWPYLPLFDHKIPLLSIFSLTYIYLPLFTYIWLYLGFITLIWAYLPLIALIWPYLPLFDPKIQLLSIFSLTYLYLPLFTYIWLYLGLITLIWAYLPLIPLILPYVPYSPYIYAFFYWDCTPVQNVRAIAPLFTEIFHFEDLGDTSVVSECSLGVNLVIDNFFYVTSDTLLLFTILKQSDHCLWRYCILKIWGIQVSTANAVWVLI